MDGLLRHVLKTISAIKMYNAFIKTFKVIMYTLVILLWSLLAIALVYDVVKWVIKLSS